MIASPQRTIVSCCLVALWAASAHGADGPPAAPQAPAPKASANLMSNHLADRLVGALPEWWKLGFEIRGRADHYLNLDGTAGRDESYYLHRFRLNSTIAVRPWLRIFTQVQDSRAVGYDRRPVPGAVANTVDLRQAYLDVGVHGESRWALRVGRQPLLFGDMRLVSTSNWSNVGPNYDAVRLTHSRPGVRLDWFASLVVTPQTGFDRPRPDKKLSGFYASFNSGKSRRSLDAYLLWKSNLHAVNEALRAGSLDVYTGGMRSAGTLGLGFDYNLELALQRGHIARDPLTAWAGHWEVGHRRRYAPEAPRLWFEYNYATGDRNPGDGRRQTFEQYYPSPWNVVGRAADIASRNLHEPLAGIEWQASRKWKFRSTLRAFWLANPRDHLYTLSGVLLAPRTGASQTRVGRETGAWAIYQFSGHLQLWAGYAGLLPGPYLRQVGKSSAIHYAFFVWTFTL